MYDWKQTNKQIPLGYCKCSLQTVLFLFIIIIVII